MEPKLLVVVTIHSIFHLMLFFVSPCVDQTWSFSAWVSHLLASLTPLFEGMLQAVFEVCASHRCLPHTHICGHALVHADLVLEQSKSLGSKKG